MIHEGTERGMREISQQISNPGFTSMHLLYAVLNPCLDFSFCRALTFLLV